MRHQDLNYLFSSLTTLSGVGDKVFKNLNRLLGTGDDQMTNPARIIDFLFHMPHALIDRRHGQNIAQAETGQIVTLKVHVDKHRPSPRSNRRIPYRVLTHDESGALSLVFFHAHQKWLEKALPIGETRYVSGKLERYQDEVQILHPDYILSEDEIDQLPLLEPIYPLTEGITAKLIGRLMRQVIDQIPQLDEWINQDLMRREQWPSFDQALRIIHQPKNIEDLQNYASARARLAYDEYFASQLALGLVRQTFKKTAGVKRQFSGQLRHQILASLPFQLTQGQQQAIQDIEEDLRLPERMLRLLQGDVGAGKTVIALAAAADVIESQAQIALMAPTEMLARQHFESISKMAAQTNIKIALLTGQDKAKEKTETLQQLATGHIDLLIGTHALFQAHVEFKNLGLVIVDEQHRFGVHQRLSLSRKGENTDILVMTATPIPRTLVMTYFGDMDVSQLKEKPAGRRDIETRYVSLERLDSVLDRIDNALQEGKKIYWVCPLIEDSEVLDLTSAEERFSSLNMRFPEKTTLIHGRMTSSDKQEIMQSFAKGEKQLLVSTTVIEVGVDVPDATIMIIENAERFGLAQLHQLRGRVGRSDLPSSCLLLHKEGLSETAHARLEVMRQTNDGFLIAEEDLRLRGEGEVLGVRQSGGPKFKIIELENHAHLLPIARDDTALVLHDIKALNPTRSKAIRHLLYLFGKDAALNLIQSG